MKTAFFATFLAFAFVAGTLGQEKSKPTAPPLRSRPAELSAADIIRTRVFEDFMSYLFKLDPSLLRPSTVYLGVDDSKDPSISLVSKLGNHDWQILNISEAGPLRADGSYVEAKKGSWSILISPIKWLNHEIVEVGVTSLDPVGPSCRYSLERMKGNWKVDNNKKCVVSVDSEHP